MKKKKEKKKKRKKNTQLQIHKYQDWNEFMQ